MNTQNYDLSSTPASFNKTEALIAVDLGAESCRVSLLTWRIDRLQSINAQAGNIEIHLVHRFANQATERADGLRWDIESIRRGVEEGIRRCAQLVSEDPDAKISSIAVDGWAVDYIRLDRDGNALSDPYCYRDTRTLEAQRALHQRIAPQRLRELTGVQLQPINTLYQQYADVLGGEEQGKLWLNLPEYLLRYWGARAVAERTNASHTQMMDLTSGDWSEEILRAARFDLSTMPPLVNPGTILGKLSGPLSSLSALNNTHLIAPCCHDTASAIAGIPAQGDDWAYISSGTWSLIGTLLDQPCRHADAQLHGFTNLSAAGGRYCFHKNLNGMWLVRQCIETWAVEGNHWQITDLIAAARSVPSYPEHELILIDDQELVLPGRMPQRINEQRARRGLDPLPTTAPHAPAMARLIFQSLASRYAEVLTSIATLSRKPLRRIFIVGGGSQNEFLNELTAKQTGMKVLRGSVESATIGNFAVQLACLNQDASAESITSWSRLLCSSTAFLHA